MMTLAEALGVDVLACARSVVQVAEANMARACRGILTARNVDASDTTLVAFGGAGGLHACALADTLGCPSVYVPPFAGLLSAKGILTARHLQQVSLPFTSLKPTGPFR